MSSDPVRCAAAAPAHLWILGAPEHEGLLQEGSAGGQSFVQALRLLQLLLQMTMAAMVTSLDPTINRGQTSGTDSHQLRALQFWLLDCIWRQCPQALYPAALDAYADLHEVGSAEYTQSWLAWARGACWPPCCKAVLQHAMCSW